MGLKGRHIKNSYKMTHEYPINPLCILYNKIIVSFQITCCFDIIYMKPHEFNIPTNTPSNKLPGKPVVNTTIHCNLPWLFDRSLVNWFPFAALLQNAKRVKTHEYQRQCADDCFLLAK